ncbi:MAG: hypothetical protein QOH03_3332 [Kribbellaceae bacterium]|jgi:hypothetical protein|nr:hypothetical protein [Kribbellaceae bacterium]
MTAQHRDDESLTQAPVHVDQADPIGPVTTPIRSKIGSRALALVGTASFSALAMMVCETSTPTTQGH